MNETLCDPTVALWIVSECNTPNFEDTAFM